MTIAREEIFGPVLAIIPYDDEADAIPIANDSDYGLWAGVWSASDERAQRVARRLRVGGVSINGAEGTDSTPFGGYKQSGLGSRDGAVRPRGVPRDQGSGGLSRQRSRVIQGGVIRLLSTIRQS